MKTEKRKKTPGAGIIVIKYFDGMPKILGLMKNGSFDLPKGSIEPGENIIHAAFRETEEESSIISLSFPWGMRYIALDSLTLFIAVTEEDPIIKKNPDTGLFEHEFAKWLHFKEEGNFKKGLRPAVQWAKSIVNGGDNVNL